MENADTWKMPTLIMLTENCRHERGRHIENADRKNATEVAARTALKNRRRSPTKSSVNVVISPMNSPLKKKIKGSRNSQVEVAQLALKYLSLKEKFMKDAAKLLKMKEQLSAMKPLL